MFTSRKSLVSGLLAAAAFAVVAGVSSLASATDVNVQFDQGGSAIYTGTAAAPDGGTFWNQANAGTLWATGTNTMTDLTASDGTTPTTVGFTLTANLGPASDGTNSWATNYYSGSGSYLNLVDYAMFLIPPKVGQLDTASLEITGLTPGGTYDMYVYGFKNYPDAYSTFTVGSTTLATDGNIVNPKTPFDAADQGATWNVFNGITATSAGDILVVLNDGPTSGYTFLNGIQIMTASPVPEPATLGLFAIGGLGLVLLGRKRRPLV